MEKIQREINNKIERLLNLEENNIVIEIKKITKNQVNCKHRTDQPTSLLINIKIFKGIYEDLLNSLTPIHKKYTKINCSQQISEIKNNLDNYNAKDSSKPNNETNETISKLDNYIIVENSKQINEIKDILDNYKKVDCSKQINEIKTNLDNSIRVDSFKQIKEIKTVLDNYRKINENIKININYPNDKDSHLQETSKKFKKLYDKLIKEYESSNMEIIKKFQYLFDLFKNFFLNVNILGESIVNNITDFENVGVSKNINDDDKKVSECLATIYKTYKNSLEEFCKFEEFCKKINTEEEKWNKEEPFMKLGKKVNGINIEIDKFKNIFPQIENYFPKINLNINEFEKIFNYLKTKIKIFQNYNKIKEISSPFGNENKMILDILIILDTTNSMGKYLNKIKKEIKNIKKKIEENCPLAIIYMGFIGYKDFCDLEYGDEYTDIDFTLNINDLYNQIKDLEVDGGGDIPEDLAGGIELALKKSWGSGLKLAILITDAPCHGTEFHDLDQNKENYKDNYPNGFYKDDKGEEYEEFKRRDINSLVQELAKKEISFVCLDILKYTEKMFNIFKEIYEKENKSEFFSIEKGNLDEIIINKATELCKSQEKGILNILRDKVNNKEKKK